MIFVTKTHMRDAGNPIFGSRKRQQTAFLVFLCERPENTERVVARVWVRLPRGPRPCLGHVLMQVEHRLKEARQRVALLQAESPGGKSRLGTLGTVGTLGMAGLVDLGES